MVAEDKLYLLITVTVDDPRAFNAFWTQHSLPYWLEFGAKHVGSFTDWDGNETSEIVRMFEFESRARFDEWEDFLRNSPAGRDLMQQLSRFNITTRTRLLRLAPRE